jgi:hypothetical protein
VSPPALVAVAVIIGTEAEKLTAVTWTPDVKLTFPSELVVTLTEPR